MVVFCDQEPPSGDCTTTVFVVNYQLVAVILLKLPKGELQLEVDHNQLRTIASETVDLIDWLLPPPYIGHYPLRSTLTVQMRVTNHKSGCASGTRTRELQNGKPPHCLCGHSGYVEIIEAKLLTKTLSCRMYLPEACSPLSHKYSTVQNVPACLLPPEPPLWYMLSTVTCTISKVREEKVLHATNIILLRPWKHNELIRAHISCFSFRSMHYSPM